MKKSADAPKGVIESIDSLDLRVTIAINEGVKKLLVTKNVIQTLLKNNYKDDPYMVYRNVEIHDFERVDDTERRNAETIEDRVFGKSKQGITDQRLTTGPA